MPYPLIDDARTRADPATSNAQLVAKEKELNVAVAINAEPKC